MNFWKPVFISIVGSLIGLMGLAGCILISLGLFYDKKYLKLGLKLFIGAVVSLFLFYGILVYFDI